MTAPALPEAVPPRTLAPGQRCRVHVVGLDGIPETIWESTELLLEAPNWAEGDTLVLNGDGLLWELPVSGGTPELLPSPGLPAVNNDHVLSPDATTIYASANDWHIWSLPRHGGAPRRITSDRGRMHFLHGVSPDGTTLAYVALSPTGTDAWAADLRLTAVDGTDDRHLPTSPRPDDGPEYSPDGAWIYFSTEMFTHAPGHAQIARMRPDGSGIEQLARTDRVDWFPHLSPTGTHATYLSYPPGTLGHPADLPVEICLVEEGAWGDPSHRIALFGGQGSMNVNSWSPDGTRFAYVDYPLAAG